MRIRFKGKSRKESPSYFSWGKYGKDLVVVGKDWCLQNDIDEAKQRTQARACFKACRSCGCCANSRRDATYPKEYDESARKMINCNKCEPFRFHDCHNGWMRNAHGEAEPFTEEAQKLFSQGGRPLI